MTSFRDSNTPRRPRHVHVLELEPADWTRLARQLLPTGYTARVIRCQALQPGDVVRAFDRVSRAAFETEVAGVFSPREYPGVQLGSVVAVLEVRP